MRNKEETEKNIINQLAEQILTDSSIDVLKMEVKFSKNKNEFNEFLKLVRFSLPVNGAIFILIIFGLERSKCFLFCLLFLTLFSLSYLPHLLVLRLQFVVVIVVSILCSLGRKKSEVFYWNWNINIETVMCFFSSSAQWKSRMCPLYESALLYLRKQNFYSLLLLLPWEWERK